MNRQDKEKKQIELVRKLEQLTKNNTVAWVKNPLNNSHIAKYKDSHFELRNQPLLVLTVDFVMEIDSDGEFGPLDYLDLAIKEQLNPSGSRYDEDIHLREVLAKLSAQ